jgi:hypothetical protein
VAAMQQIADWLEKLGVSEYAKRFAENDIDVEVLSELTDKDFDRLGVSIGHRRKMIRAIRDFAASPVSAVTERSAPAAITAPAAPTDTAERRQSPSCFRTSSVRRLYLRAWIPKTCAKSFRRIKIALLEP